MSQNKRFRVNMGKTMRKQQWTCYACDCHKDTNPQNELDFHFREALRRTGPYNVIKMKNIMRRVAKSKYHAVLPFFEDLKAFAVDSTSRLDMINPVHQYLFEFSPLLTKLEEALEEWEDNLDRQIHPDAVVVTGLNTSLISADGTEPATKRLRNLARVNYNQEEYFDNMLEEGPTESSGPIDSKMNAGVLAGKDWRLSKSRRWVKIFAQGPKALISTKALESILANPMRCYIEQRQFTSFLQLCADMFEQHKNRCGELDVKSQAVGQFLSVWMLWMWALCCTLYKNVPLIEPSSSDLKTRQYVYLS